MASQANGGGSAFQRLKPSLVLNGLIPLVVYMVLRSRVDSDTVALAIGAAIPVLVSVGGFIWRRRLDPIGVGAVLAFAVALIALVLSGGNPLVLKLHDAIITGPLGVVCLLSVLIGKPLLLLVQRMVARHRPGVPAPTLNDAAHRRAVSVITALVGGTLVVHAALILLLALSLSTSTFLSVGRPIGWAVLAAGLAAIMRHRSHLHSRAAGPEAG